MDLDPKDDEAHGNINIEVTVVQGADKGGGRKTLHISPSTTLQQLIEAASERLNLEAKDVKVYTADGQDIDDIAFIRNNDVLYLIDKNKPFLRAKGEDFVGSYVVGEFLGQGAFGKVHLGVHERTGEKAALKFMSKEQMGSMEDAERVLTEVQCLNSLEHPNVIKLLHVANTLDDVVLAFEYAAGGDLREFVQAQPDGYLSEKTSAKVLLQLIDGVDYCHRKNVIHYDLKLDNILLVNKVAADSGAASVSLEDLVVKIADFGLSQVCRPGEKATKYHAGSLAYIAPEVHGDKETAGPPRDVWALGVILFAMVCGKLPFGGKTKTEVVDKVQEGKLFYTRDVSVALKKLLGGLLHVDPEKRSTLSQIRSMSWLEKSNDFSVGLQQRLSIRMDEGSKGEEMASKSIQLGEPSETGDDVEQKTEVANTQAESTLQQTAKVGSCGTFEGRDRTLAKLDKELEKAISRHNTLIHHPPKIKTARLSTGKGSRKLRPTSVNSAASTPANKGAQSQSPSRGFARSTSAKSSFPKSATTPKASVSSKASPSKRPTTDSSSERVLIAPDKRKSAKPMFPDV